MPFFLWCDVLSAEALVWIGRRGERSELTPEAHSRGDAMRAGPSRGQTVGRTAA